MILTCRKMQALEEKAFAEGITAEALMRDAGRQLAEVVRELHPAPGHASVYCGKGHNGGDALVAAKHLAGRGWKISLTLAAEESKLSPLTLRMLKEAEPHFSPKTKYPDIILDGLLGIGARGALREELRALTREINATRRYSNTIVVSVDLPSGLPDPDTVIADATATIGFAKEPLFADNATQFVGRLFLLPLTELSQRIAVDNARPELSTPQTLAPLLPRRHYTAHKGAHGRVGIIAGSLGFTGAAALTAHAALRAGAGLVTVYAEKEIHSLIAHALPPEIMVRPVDSFTRILEERMDVLAIGPGLGLHRAEEIRSLLRDAPVPAVVDADALNAWAEKPFAIFRAPRLFTPHPGEMERLLPNSSFLSRVETAKQFTSKYPVTLLLKGARSLIAEAGKNMVYNSTGGPMLAKGGSGDVLTGVCAALSAQGLTLRNAARLGAWLCGRAAEHAQTHAAETVIASDVLQNLGKAFHSLRSRQP